MPKDIYKKTSAVHYLSHPYFNRLIGQRLCILREERMAQAATLTWGIQKWSQAWLGWQLNYGNQKISGWENGTAGISQVDLLRLLALFDISLEEFLGDAELPSLYEMIKHIEDN